MELPNYGNNTLNLKIFDTTDLDLNANPDDYIYYRESKYCLTESNTTWELAQEEAFKLGGNLVKIESELEQLF